MFSPVFTCCLSFYIIAATVAPTQRDGGNVSMEIVPLGLPDLSKISSQCDKQLARATEKPLESVKPAQDNVLETSRYSQRKSTLSE